jgi:dynein heavy chain
MAFRKDKRVQIPLAMDPTVTSGRNLAIPPIGSAPAAQSNTHADSDGKFSDDFIKTEVQFLSLKKPLPKIGDLEGSVHHSDANLVAKPPPKLISVLKEASQSIQKPQDVKGNYPTKRPQPFVEMDVYTQTDVIINYRKALEPKVMTPYVAQPGQTPRLIDIERRKRAYLSHNLENVLRSELLSAMQSLGKPLPNQDFSFAKLIGRDMTDYVLALPLEAFDDTEFDPRTPNDWLDVNTVADDAENALVLASKRYSSFRGLVKEGFSSIRFAVTPLPAKAFDQLEWRTCIVVAHDVERNLWKVKWRNFTASELKANGSIADDEQLVDDYANSDVDPTEIIQGKEMWVNRYIS